MFSKAFTNSYGSSLAAAVLAVTVAAGLAGTASASVIYSDSFPGSTTGSPSGSLNGTTPATDTGGATWTADTAWLANGSIIATVANYDAYLPFAPTGGQIYTLSEGINATSNATGFTNGWIGLAFLASGALGQPLSTSSTGGANAEPWMIDYVPNSGSNIVTYSTPTSGFNYAYPASGVQSLMMVLNTVGASWTVKFSDNGTALGSLYTYTTNPTIADVGFGSQAATGQVSNFSLTDVAVPEPATMGLVGIGALGLLLLKRRKTA